MEFVVDKVALGQFFFMYFGFACQFPFHRLLHIHLSSGTGTIGQLAADLPSGLSLTPPQETKKEKVLAACESGRGRKSSATIEPSVFMTPSLPHKVGLQGKTTVRQSR
jgi:hypothetical protein